MSLETIMVSIDPHFTIKDGKMDLCIALLEEILVMKKKLICLTTFFQYNYLRIRQGICERGILMIKIVLPLYFILRNWTYDYDSQAF